MTQIVFLGVFGRTLLHSRTALLYNFRLEQFCSRVLDKINVHRSTK
jgi:hypothetical protein